LHLFGLLLLVVELVWLLLLFGFELVVLELVEQELGNEKERRKERGAMGGKAGRKAGRWRKMKTELGAATAATNYNNGGSSLAMQSAHKLVRRARGRSLLIHL
jgi:hypothetical protein